MPNNPKTDERPRSFLFYLILGAALFAFIQTFSLLSPILFSFLMILLISPAVNPVISRMRTLKAGRKSATGLIVSALVVLIALTGWAFFGPMNNAITKLSKQLPSYWERLQKPLIMARSMELHPVAVIFSMLLCVAAFGVLGVLVAAPLVAVVNIVHDELYRKRFLPTVTDADLDHLSQMALGGKH